MLEFNMNETASIIFSYAVSGYSQQTIAEDMDCSIADISNLLTRYHLIGPLNLLSPFRRLKNRGAYKQYKTPEGYSLPVKFHHIQEYVERNYNRKTKETLDYFLNEEKEKPVIFIWKVLLLIVSIIYLVFYLWITPINIRIEPQDKFSFAPYIEQIKAFFVSIEQDIKNEYVPEVQEYFDKKYLCNFTAGKPNGLGLRLDDGALEYSFGIFDGEFLNDKGIIENSSYKYVGELKQGVPNGIGIYIGVNGTCVANFKSGVATGYGIIYNKYGEHKLVKFFNNSWPGKGLTLEKSYELIGKFDKLAGTWKSAKGGYLETKNNSYQNIQMINDRHILINKEVHIWFNEDEVKYEKGTFYMTLSDKKAKISDNGEDLKKRGGIWINYDIGREIQGQINKVSKNSATSQNFTVEIT